MPSESIGTSLSSFEIDNLPEKPPRSKLEPHRELIRELRRRGRTYRELASIFRERFGLEVAASTIHSFVKVRANHRRQVQFELPSEDVVGSSVRSMSAEERIAALKAQPATKSGRRKPFTFQENEPLKLVAGGKQ
jgi:hypothetical protein